MNPAQFRLLLAGPKVCRLLPFFSSRGYVADACPSGEEALEHMRDAPRHVLLVELDLGDMLLADLIETVRRENLAGAIILLEDPAKSGLIVSSLIRGVDGYVATPPDEMYLFRIIERQLLAQWALAQSGQASVETEAKQRVEKSLLMERAKVTELVREIASLREEIQRARRGAPSQRKAIEDALDDGSGTFDPDVGEEEKTGDFDVATDAHPTIAASQQKKGAGLENLKTAPTRRPAPAHLADDRTSPAGFPAPSFAKPGSNDGGFDDVPMTKPSNTEVSSPKKAPPKPAPKPASAAAAATVDERSESDLFLDIDEDADEEEVDDETKEMDAQGPPTIPKRRFLLTPDPDEE